MGTAETWREFIQENLEASGDYYIPPSRKRVVVITSTTFYDLEPAGDSTTIQFDIRDNHSLISYYVDVFNLEDDDNITYFIPWVLITDILFEARDDLIALEDRIIELELQGFILIWVRGENLTDQVNNVDTIFGAKNHYYPNTLEVFLNGVRLLKDYDYIEHGTVESPENTFQLIRETPLVDDSLIINYCIAISRSRLAALKNRIEQIEILTGGEPLQVQWIKGEDLTGQVTNVSNEYELNFNYWPGTTEVFYEGLRLHKDISYTENGDSSNPSNKINLNFTLRQGDSLVVNYGRIVYSSI